MVDETKTEERALGWLLHVQSMRFLEAGDPSDELLDAQPIFVHRHRGTAHWAKPRGPSEFAIDGEPDHDWPQLAHLLVPLAAVAHAVAWIALWWAVYGFALAVGFFVFHLAVIGAGVLILVVPVNVVIGWARFRNFDRWLGLTIVLLGTIVGEFAAAKLGLMPQVVFEEEFLGFDFEIPLEFLRAITAMGSVGLGLTLGQGNKTSTTAWNDSPLLRAPPEDDD